MAVLPAVSFAVRDCAIRDQEGRTVSLVSIKRRTIVVMEDVRTGWRLETGLLTDHELQRCLGGMRRNREKLLYLVRCRPRGAPRFKDAMNLPDRLT
jgi:hypothetical protein